MIKPKSLYQLIQENCNAKYDSKNVMKYVVVIKHTNNNRLQERFKIELFIALSKLIMKSMNNFFKLIKNVPEHKRLHNNDDIANECYLVLHRCILNVKMEYVSKFYYYYNNGLNKAIYRLYEKNYVKHFDVVDNGEDHFSKLENKGYNHNFDLTEIDLSVLTELELEIIKAKLAEEKQKNIIKRLAITNEQFYDTFEIAKQKIKQIYNYEPAAIYID